MKRFVTFEWELRLNGVGRLCGSAHDRCALRRAAYVPLTNVSAGVNHVARRRGKMVKRCCFTKEAKTLLKQTNAVIEAPTTSKYLVNRYFVPCRRGKNGLIYVICCNFPPKWVRAFSAVFRRTVLKSSEVFRVQIYQDALASPPTCTRNTGK